VSRIGGAGLIIFAALVVLAAQITTNMAANVVSPSNDFSNLSPKRISYVRGGLITAVIGILMMPWKLYSDAAAYIFTWLLGYSSLMGALGGILIADYWVLRRQRLLVGDLFREQGAYTYRSGYNWRAIAALVLSVLPVVPGFIRAATTAGGQVANRTVFDHLYSYAWFVTFALSFGIYLVLSKAQGSQGAQGQNPAPRAPGVPRAP
jgi:nucleobase:cation symporter-1, NCS1 family